MDDSERLRFLFGEVPLDSLDLDDDAVRSRLLRRSFERNLSYSVMLGYEMAADQIYVDDPPEVWSTAQRLTGLGFDREEIFNELAMALTQVLTATLQEEQVDMASYVITLNGLPVPSADQISPAMLGTVRTNPGISADDVVADTLAQFGRDPGDKSVAMLTRAMLDHLTDEAGLLVCLPGDRLVRPDSLTAGIVLTHRLSEAEQTSGALDAVFDLAGLGSSDLHLATGELLKAWWDKPPPKAKWVKPPDPNWIGPTGWLDAYEAGTVLAVSVSSDGEVNIDPLTEPPPVDQALAERLRSAYDDALDERWLPVSAHDLLLALLCDTPELFDRPTAPLVELCQAAGLDRFEDRVAHDESVWHHEIRTMRQIRTNEMLVGDEQDPKHIPKIMQALDVADLLSGVDPDLVPGLDGPVDTPMLKSLLADLKEIAVLLTVADELFSNEHGAPAQPGILLDQLLELATRPWEKAATRYIAAIQAERANDPVAAEQHLQLGYQSDPKAGFLIASLAWYASDRGDGPESLRLWRRLEPRASLTQDIAVVEDVMAGEDRLGRNEPCWCGSGRKYKQCHFGAARLPPLPERVGWLRHKAISFLLHHGHEGRLDIMAVALARASDPNDRAAIDTAFEDPIVFDLALHEGGWFGRFLTARGPLLPDDEAILASSWRLVDRTIYQVLKVEAGESLVLSDLRTGYSTEVQDRSFSRQAEVDQLICARALPDGKGDRLIAGYVPVSPGQEEGLFELLDKGDPVRIAQWVAVAEAGLIGPDGRL